ncbi:MAG: ATP-dependent DNA helicase RecG [Candidatus Latescibacterota bacterium]|nr:MAG: ATP-dependent DNA helicase RecG [Candidatus Latescibacterota bacterium]
MGETKKTQRDVSDVCRFLKGVGPARAEHLRRLGIETVDDLLTHFPRKYYDRRNLTKIGDVKVGDESSFTGQILSVAKRSIRGRRSMVTAAIADDTGVVQVVWFNQPYLAKILRPGSELIVTGELSYYRGARQIVNPEFEVLEKTLDQELLHTGRIVPVYPLTRGLSQRFLRELIARTLDAYAGTVYENLPDSLIKSASVVSRVDALLGVHFPLDRTEYERAVNRLKIEELFYLQLAFSLHRLQRSDRPARRKLAIEYGLWNRFLASLPFELTGAQQRVLSDIRSDLESDQGMHRLLQGDVGSGKTVVAGMAMLAAVEAGKQAALMVPTEILAGQHASTLSEFFEPLGVPVTFLIGSLKAGEKRRIHGDIANGSARIVVGTHALIQEGVEFNDLGVVVVDEQHRFGVRQRAALLGKGQSPHMLVMTATPIPRTLALTAYADLDLSVIDEMPKGRAPVKTGVVPPDRRDAMIAFIREQVAGGFQAYFLYPLIDDTEKQDVEAAVSAYEELSNGALSDIPVGMLHGRMSYAEKDAAMTAFCNGETRVLVATTVVEVGVHVPQATIMVIHHPERFGLSQIHQLRGRVGRGGQEGYCFLLVNEGVPQSARERLDVLVRVSDGFEIAEADLRIRGPGEFFGVRQHGVPALKIANPAIDRQAVEVARRHVKNLLDTAPRLEGRDAAPCRRYLSDIGVDLTSHTIG